MIYIAIKDNAWTPYNTTIKFFEKFNSTLLKSQADYNFSQCETLPGPLQFFANHFENSMQVSKGIFFKIQQRKRKTERKRKEQKEKGNKDNRK